MDLISIKEFALFGYASETRVTINKRHGTGSSQDFSSEISSDELSYACWNRKKKRNFAPGMYNMVFVKIGRNEYLFCGLLRIDAIPEGDGPCGYTDVSSEFGFGPYVRKLSVLDTRPSKTQLGAWVFRFDRIKDLSVMRFDSKAEWSQLRWTGYDAVNLTFKELFDTVESNRYPEFRTHLEDVCGVYVLTDRASGKLYIGSAYGEKGLAQRWGHYLDSCHGGNKMLKELYDRKGPAYFRDNFGFRLLYHYPLGTDPKRVIARESFFKEVFGTRIDGYNAN